MKIVNKEQERIEQEQTPEAKRKATRSGIFALVFFVCLVGGVYLLDHNPNISGKPYPVKLEGVTVIPGETTVGELTAAGYDISDSEHGEWVMTLEDHSGHYYYEEVVDMTVAEADARTYYYLILVKDGMAYANIVVQNNAGIKKSVADCEVRSVEVHSFNEGLNQAALNGVSFAEVSEEALNQSTGEQPEMPSDGKYVWKKRRYSMTLNVGDDGKVESILSEYILK